ncbi:MAG TPA: hypothetical protein VK718_03410 [Ferruginibacter sp.]|jgi:hypothetical protein|nr:hypothetical protein [Ferruginibacter sp.]
MKKNSRVSLIIILLMFPFIVQAQANKDSAINLFRETSNKYNGMHYLSFRMDYSYRNDANPKVLLDSLMGEVMVNGDNCHIILGNTETIRNNDYNIMLFKEDTLMYISKPKIITLNPITILNNLITQLSNEDVSLVIKRSLGIITINFPIGNDYKKIEFFINLKSGYLIKVRYIVKATQLINEEDRPLADKDIQNEWAIVECNYDNYKVGAFNDSEFDVKKYFIKDGKEYKPTEAYKQYKIFIASPGL